MKVLYFPDKHQKQKRIWSSMSNEILTIKQVADYLKVNERTIYKLASKEKIPAFKVGGSWRFQHKAIERWIEQQSTNTK